MPDDYRIARFKAYLVKKSIPSKRMEPVKYTPEEVAEMLMDAVSMQDIKDVAAILGLTFNEAYAERKRLYKARWGI
jgi:hypothetical protein